MASASIIIQQNDSNQIPGSRDDLVLHVAVTLLNQVNTNVTSWLWQITDRPQGSTAVLSSAVVPSPTFIPDVAGTYLIKLTINNGTSIDQQGAAIKTAGLHYRIPAAAEDGEFDHVRGWAEAINDALQKLDDGYVDIILGGAGGNLPDQAGHTGQFLTTDGSAASWALLTQDMIAAAFTATLSYGGSSVVEVGSTVTQPAFTAAYNRPAAAATLNDGAGAIGLALPATSFAYNGLNTLPSRNYTKNTINAATAFTLSANESGGPIKTSSRTITWEARIYFDTQTPPGSFNAAFIMGLANSTLAGGFARTISFPAGNNTKKMYYAFPTSFGTPSSFKDTNTGFAIPFSKVASSVSVTNAFGVTIGYDIWGADNFTNAAVTVVVA